eukprot:Sro1443_g273160.2  (662) ;mRNA; r:11405-13390
MAERPTTWNGGEGEEVAHSYLQKPKTKLKDSWLKDGSGTGMSQSMRDLSTDGKQNDDMNASDSQLFSARRRQTSPMVMEKLLDLNKQNEENHKKNEEIDPWVASIGKSPPAKVWKPPKKADEAHEEAKTDQVSPKASSKDKVKFQKDENLYMAERPTTWNGGEGEKVALSYLQKPKTKLKDSWLKGGSGSGMSQSMRDLSTDEKHNDDMNASDTQLFSARRRQTSPMVMEKLLDLNKQNEENHKKNEEIDPWVASIGKSPPAKVWKPPKKADEAHEEAKTEQVSPKASSKDKVKFQKDENLYMAERPTTWNGGEGEEVALSYLQKPKTKLKDSWLKGGSGSGMSQSMRDLSTDEKHNDDMNASDTQLFSARRRQTSPMVMEKLLDLNKQNEENHKKNEEIDPWVASIGKSPPAKVWKPPKKADGAHEEAKTDQVSPKASSKDKVKFQKDENLYMAERPTTWNGGEGEEVALSYLQKPKTKLKDSWLKGGSGSGMSQSMRDLSTDEKHNDDMNASDTQLFSARRRKTSPMVMEKLLDLNKQNEENHKKNEELDPGAVSVEATKVWKPVKQSNTADDEEQGAQDESGGQSYTPNNQEKIKLQREDVAHLVARPVAWMGGEGEEAQPYSLTHASPKAKLKDSWQKSDASGGKMEGLKIDSLVDS